MAATRARSASDRTMSAEARPPKTSPSASTTMDLPLPVSPVSRFKPGVKPHPDALHHRVILDNQFQQHSMKLYEVSVRLTKGRSCLFAAVCVILLSRAICKTEQGVSVFLRHREIVAARYHGFSGDSVEPEGAWLILPRVGGLFLQLEVWDLVQSSGPLPKAVMVILLGFSLASWAVILSKWAVVPPCALGQSSFPAGLPQSPGARYHRRGQRTIPALPAGGGFRFRIQRSGAPDEIARQRHQSAGAGAHLATRDERRADAPGAQHELPGHHRRRLAVHRTVRHGVGHHRRVPAIGHGGRRQPAGRCPGHLRSAYHHGAWVFLPPSPRTFSTTCSAAPSRNSARAWKTSSSSF